MFLVESLSLANNICDKDDCNTGYRENVKHTHCIIGYQGNQGKTHALQDISYQGNQGKTNELQDICYQGNQGKTHALQYQLPG